MARQEVFKQRKTRKGSIFINKILFNYENQEQKQFLFMIYEDLKKN